MNPQRPTPYELELKLRAHPDWTFDDNGYSHTYRHVAGHWLGLFDTRVHLTASGKKGMSWPLNCVCWHVAVRLYARQYEVPDIVGMLLPCAQAVEIPALVLELRSISTGFLP